MKTTLTPSEQHMVTLVVIIAECLFKAETLSDRPHYSTAYEYIDKVFELCKLDKKELNGVFEQAVEDIKLSCNL
jgi:hypothetical protein